jgi:hypothetical protein
MPENPYPKRVTILVTADEKRAVRMVAAMRDVTESELCRDMLLSDVVALYRSVDLPKIK